MNQKLFLQSSQMVSAAQNAFKAQIRLAIENAVLAYALQPGGSMSNTIVLQIGRKEVKERILVFNCNDTNRTLEITRINYLRPEDGPVQMNEATAEQLLDMWQAIDRAHASNNIKVEAKD